MADIIHRLIDDDEDYGTVMVALVPDAEVTEELADLGYSEPAEKMHITLALIPERDDETEAAEDLLGIKRVIEAFASAQPPLEYRVQGFGVFDNDNKVLWSSIDSPGLNTFRRDLVDLLDDTGYEIMDDHSFIPHITLEYSDSKITEIPTVPANLKSTGPDRQFTHLWVCKGQEWVGYPLEGGRTAAKLAGLSLENYISVAEKTMEDQGHTGRVWDLKPGHVDDPQYKAQLKPLNDWARDVAREEGHPHFFKVYNSEYQLDTAGGNPQAMTSNMGNIVTRNRVNDLSILHEIAHVIHQSTHGMGHTPEFAKILGGLYEKHLGPEAAGVYNNIVSMHDSMKRTAGPGSGRIPRALRQMSVPFKMLKQPRKVVLDKPAQQDLEHVPAGLRARVLDALDRVQQGTAELEAKVRELTGAFAVRITNSWRAAFYMGVDALWHCFWIGDHNYDEAERRFGSMVSLGRVAVMASLHPANEMPPEPGSSPIPQGHIRLFHYTHPDNLPSIRDNGLDASKGRGDGGMGYGNEPSAGIWAATDVPKDTDIQNKPYVEFHVHPNDIGVNGPDDWRGPEYAQEWNKGSHNVLLKGSVPADQIVAIHEPWHTGVRHMQEGGGPDQYGFVREQAAAGDPEMAKFLPAFDWFDRHKHGAFNESEHPRNTSGQFTFDDDIPDHVRAAAHEAGSLVHRAGIDPGKVFFRSEGASEDGFANAARDKMYLSPKFMDDGFVAGRDKDWKDLEVGAGTGDVQKHRRNVLVHEMGHILFRRAEEASPEAKKALWNVLTRPMTPRETGFTVDNGSGTLDTPQERWQHDSLRGPDGKHRSVYANENKYEWAAEAFADAVLHGDKASAGGKELLAAIKKHLSGPVGLEHAEGRYQQSDTHLAGANRAQALKSENYSGYRLLDSDQILGALIGQGVKPQYENLDLHHVTHKYPDTEVAPEAKSVRIVGHSAHDGVQALAVQVDGTSVRPDGGMYHITYSLDPGHKPVESNHLLAKHEVVPLKNPLDINVEPF